MLSARSLVSWGGGADGWPVCGLVLCWLLYWQVGWVHCCIVVSLRCRKLTLAALPGPACTSVSGQLPSRDRNTPRILFTVISRVSPFILDCSFSVCLAGWRVGAGARSGGATGAARRREGGSIGAVRRMQHHQFSKYKP